jgi:hypothetical protein
VGEEAWLGQAPDAALARHLRRTLAAVRFRRGFKGIPACALPKEQWSVALPALRQLGRALAAINPAPSAAKPPPPRPSARAPRSPCRRWTAAEDALLGRMSDVEAARRLGRAVHSVRHRRLCLGRLKPPPTPPWTAEEDALLGTLPDRELARKLNRSAQAVAARRQHRGIAPVSTRASRKTPR